MKKPISLTVLLLTSLMLLVTFMGPVASQPASCTGACTTPGLQCCWQTANGAYQNTCIGDDFCTTGCFWGPPIHCGLGGNCEHGQGPGKSCTFGQVIIKSNSELILTRHERFFFATDPLTAFR